MNVGFRVLSVIAVAVIFATGCSSAPSVSVPDNASPSDVYLSAVCGSGQERLTFTVLAQGYQQGQGIAANQVLEAADRALAETRNTAAVLRATNISWPASVSGDVQKVASSEETIADDLQTLMESSEVELGAALEIYFSRPDTSDGAGQRIRSQLGLGKPGDCPVSPASERAFIALIQRFAPTVYERGNDAVLALGRETCVILGLKLNATDELDQVKALGLSEAQAAVFLESAKDYVCDNSNDQAAEDTGTAVVDTILDEMVEGTLILTQRNPQSRPDVIRQFEDARARWAGAYDLLETDRHGAPADVSQPLLRALDRSLNAMTGVINCLSASSASSCTIEIDTNTRLSRELGSELASFIPYGSRSGEEVLAAIRGEGSASGSTRSPNQGSGAESTSQSNALRKANEYLRVTAFSRQGLIDQLKYEGFSPSDATYAADAVGADWNQQAALKAKEYLDVTGFSRTGLIEQLQFEGFTLAQATYGARAVGL